MNLIYVRKTDLNDPQTPLEFEQEGRKTERPLEAFLKNGASSYCSILKTIPCRHTHLIIASESLKTKKTEHYHKHPQYDYIDFTYEKKSFGQRKTRDLIEQSSKHWATKTLKELRPDVYSNNPQAIKAFKDFKLSKSLANMRIDF